MEHHINRSVGRQVFGGKMRKATCIVLNKMNHRPLLQQIRIRPASKLVRYCSPSEIYIAADEWYWMILMCLKIGLIHQNSNFSRTMMNDDKQIKMWGTLFSGKADSDRFNREQGHCPFWDWGFQLISEPFEAIQITLTCSADIRQGRWWRTSVSIHTLPKRNVQQSVLHVMQTTVWRRHPGNVGWWLTGVFWEDALRSHFWKSERHWNETPFENPYLKELVSFIMLI